MRSYPIPMLPWSCCLFPYVLCQVNNASLYDARLSFLRYAKRELMSTLNLHRPSGVCSPHPLIASLSIYVYMCMYVYERERACMLYRTVWCGSRTKRCSKSPTATRRRFDRRCRHLSSNLGHVLISPRFTFSSMSDHRGWCVHVNVWASFVVQLLLVRPPCINASSMMQARKLLDLSYIYLCNTVCAPS